MYTHTHTSVLCRPVQGVTVTNDSAARFAHQVLAKHATAAEHAADVAAGFSPNSKEAAEHRAATAAAAADAAANAATMSAALSAKSQSRGAAAEFLRVAEAETGAIGDDDDAAAAAPIADVGGGGVREAHRAGNEHKLRDTKAPEEQLAPLASVLASIHAQAQELMWQQGLLRRGTALAQSKVIRAPYIYTYTHAQAHTNMHTHKSHAHTITCLHTQAHTHTHSHTHTRADRCQTCLRCSRTCTARSARCCVRSMPACGWPSKS